MSVFLDHPEFYNKPIRLTVEQMENPLQVLAAFFGDTNLSEVRYLFDEILETCLITDSGPFEEGTERGILIRMLEKMEILLEAVSVLVNSKDAGPVQV